MTDKPEPTEAEKARAKAIHKEAQRRGKIARAIQNIRRKRINDKNDPKGN